MSRYTLPIFPFVAQFEVEKWFSDKFQKRFGSPPLSRAAQVYDMIHLLAIAASKSGKLPTPETVVNAIKDLPEGSGAAGELIINSPRVVESKCVWKVSRHGTYELFK